MDKDRKCCPSIDASSKVDSQGGVRRVNGERVFLIICIPNWLARTNIRILESCTSTVAVGGAPIKPEAFT